MSTFPSAFFVTNSKLEESAESDDALSNDPRGVVWLFEPPRKHARYIMGMDTAEGITGWSRAIKSESDAKRDNSAIEIFRVDGAKELAWKEDADGNRTPEIDPRTNEQKWIHRDVQVAEFAAPIDPVETARIAGVLGKVFQGDADDQCELIWEAWPGCGMLATQELLRIGYSNLWHWEYIADAVEETERLGWRSNRESMKLLWYRARRHLMERRAVIRSRALLDEYANAEIDLDKMRARAAYGFHDDRFMAANLALWAGHKWVYDIERSWEQVTQAPPVVDFQRRAPGMDDDEVSFADWKRRATEDWEY
jgi:hypothetical protein